MKPEEKAQNEIVAKFLADEQSLKEPGATVVFRTGEAEEIEKPLHNDLSGVISAPAKFYSIRKELHDKNKCHVLFNRNNKEITLIVDEKSRYGYKITGRITSNPDLDAFGINSKKTYGVKDLMQLLKFNRVFFLEVDKNAAIVTALQQFKAKVQTEIEKQNDNRGTSRNVDNISLEHSLQENFVLEMPIFRGGEKKQFLVDICVTITDGSIVLWLESRDLRDLQTTESSRLVDAELKAFDGLVVIEQ